MTEKLTDLAVSARQYYQDNYGGYVECCEEVVDPLILFGVIAGIAGLTYFLRSQVIRFIKRRRSFDSGSEEEFLENLHNAQIVMESMASFAGLLQTEEEKKERELDESLNEIEDNSSMKCYVSTGICLFESLQVSLKSKSSETDILWTTLEGAVEYAVTRNISTTWPKLKKYEAVDSIAACVNNHYKCDA